jgi:hypothetical protein
MKAKKAVKRLARAEAILTEVIKEYQLPEPQLRSSLETAKTSLVKVRESVARISAAKVAKKKVAAKVATPTPAPQKKAAAKAKSVTARKTSPAKKKHTSKSPRRTQEILDRAEPSTPADIPSEVTAAPEPEQPAAEMATEQSFGSSS